MVTNFRKTINVSANIEIDDVLVISARATINPNGQMLFNKTVRDTELYIQNMEQCDTDYANFEAQVRELV